MVTNIAVKCDALQISSSDAKTEAGCWKIIYLLFIKFMMYLWFLSYKLSLKVDLKGAYNEGKN